jgi:acyl carrier protein
MIANSDALVVVMEVIGETSGISNIDPDGDFYEAGVTSIQALPLLMELESRFDVSIPDDRFMAARTPRALSVLIESLRNA